MADETPILPAHIEGTVQAIARLHAEHHRQASPMQRAFQRFTSAAGRPQFLFTLLSLVALWAVFNVVLALVHRAAPDPPPFFWLQGVVSLSALCMTVVILTTQRREDQIAEHRDQLTLELAILAEQKTAKLIQLVEELRRDSPHLPNRKDEEAEALAQPADPQAVLEAIRETHAELIEGQDLTSTPLLLVEETLPS